MLVKHVKNVQNASRKVGGGGRAGRPSATWALSGAGAGCLAAQAATVTSGPSALAAARPLRPSLASLSPARPPARPPAAAQVYMLYELQPAKEITGGPWYGPDSYDSEFIGVLRQVGTARAAHAACFAGMAAACRGGGGSPRRRATLGAGHAARAVQTASSLITKLTNEGKEVTVDHIVDFITERVQKWLAIKRNLKSAGGGAASKPAAAPLSCARRG